MIDDRQFWRDALERAVKTAAQLAVATIGTGVAGILDVDWQGVAAAAGLGFVLSILTSLASEPFGDVGTPSLVPASEDPWTDEGGYGADRLRATDNSVKATDPVQDVSQDPATDYGE